MDEVKKLLLETLNCAVRGKAMRNSDKLDCHRWDLYLLALEHHVLPFTADALYEGREDKQIRLGMDEQAKHLAVIQAQQTADFLLFYEALKRHGLFPTVVKGIVCRSLYPKPELRPSVDEDLLIQPEEYEQYCHAFAEAGFQLVNGSDYENYEVSFTNPDSHLCIELHTSLFPDDSDSYGDCAAFFADALDRAIEVQINGTSVRTLAPTDHLLFLICHAYKHFLHGGVGIRQLCDMALMAEKYDAQIDWLYIRQACDELNISVFTAAMYQICKKHLGFSVPDSFSDIETDEKALLEDILSGGVYGVIDLDRAHSSTITLEAVSADRGGRKRKGALHTVFLPLDLMKGKFPYLRKYPWLLPAAWTQRVFRYLMRKDHSDPVNPARSVQIARERIELLRQYGIIR